MVINSKHTVPHIFHKILATGRPVAKTLIKYNSNSLEKNEEKEEKESIDIEFTEENSDPELMKMLYSNENLTIQSPTPKL